MLMRWKAAITRNAGVVAMPLTPKGESFMSAMQEKYGAAKGESVFYASRNAGTITGVDSPLGAIPAELSVKQIVAEGLQLGPGWKVGG